MGKIISATGFAATPRRGAYARELEGAVQRAISRAEREGVTDPAQIKARVQAARALVQLRHARGR